jgi:hypothetical protein
MAIIFAALIEAAMIGLEITVKLDATQHADYLARLDSIVSLLQIGNQTGGKIMGILDDIEAEVQESTSVEGSIEALISNLVDAAEANKTDPVRLQAVLDTLRANDGRLAKLVTDNTPAATPGPAPDPAPVVNPLRT